MQNWMKKLALHYEKTKQRYPNSNLMILFDIDGTILDMRYLIHHVLEAFDGKHGTRFFKNLSINAIRHHENQIESLLIQLDIPPKYRGEILSWYHDYRW